MPTMSFLDGTVGEAATPGDPSTMWPEIVLSAPLLQDTSVRIVATAGTATVSPDLVFSAGEDLVDPAVAPGLVLIPAGTTAVRLELTVFADDLVEGDSSSTSPSTRST